MMTKGRISPTLNVQGLTRTGPVRISSRKQSLILAMIEAGFRDQQIHAFFSQPGGDFNHNRVAALRKRRAQRDPSLPSAVSETELQAFIDGWISHRGLPDPFSAWWANGADASLWRVEYHFHPVGQGLLHSGALRQGRRRPFAWIYDCGSRSSQIALEAELDGIPPAIAAAGGTATLGLVTLSHFDQDHVSGLVHLLGIVQIEILLLPFLPLWQRLWIAAAAESLDVDLLTFLVDPTGYIAAAADDGGRPRPRIVFVGASDPDAPPGPPAPAGPAPDDGTAGDGADRPDPDPPRARKKRPDRDGDGDDRPMQLRLETDPAPNVVAGEIAGVTGGGFGIAEFLKVGSVLEIDGLWEFVPYNDARQVQQCPAGFPAKIEPLVKALLAAPDEPARKNAFDVLKGEYTRTFGATGYRKNVISLFLYAGPVQDPTDADFWTGRVDRGGRVKSWCRDNTRPAPGRFALLFTGDGFLSTKPRRDAFASFYRAYRRLERTAVFQVMHHGASPNSSDEVAPLVAPLASIFSSDPGHFDRHPDADVLRQFWPYNCIQVDTVNGWGLRGVFEF